LGVGEGTSAEPPVLLQTSCPNLAQVSAICGGRAARLEQQGATRDGKEISALALPAQSLALVWNVNAKIESLQS